VVVAVALASVFGLAGTAFAQETTLTMNVETPSPLANELVTVTTAGTTIQTSPLYLYYELDGANCALSQGEQFLRPNAHTFDILYPSSGKFNYTSSFKPVQGGNYRICAYLYLDTDNPGSQAPRTLVTTTIDVAIKPGTDQDGDKIPDAVDSCKAIASTEESGCPKFVAPTVSVAKQKAAKGAYAFTVTCNQACDMTYTATVGGIKLQPGSSSTTDAKAKRLTIRLTKANLKKLKKLLKKRASITGTLTVSALDLPAGSTTEEPPPPLVTKRSFTITR
jgi:hypothetical protein